LQTPGRSKNSPSGQDGTHEDVLIEKWRLGTIVQVGLQMELGTSKVKPSPHAVHFFG